MNFREAAGTVILAVLILGACDREQVHAKVCVYAPTDSPDVYTRLKDSDCRNGKDGARWRYYSGGTHIGKIGDGVGRRGGSWSEPSGSVVYIPAKGGTANEVADKG